MTPKVFLGLLAATGLAIVAAILAVLAQPIVSTVRVDNAPAFPALNGRPEAAAKVSIESREFTFNMARQADGTWGALDRHGYPVRNEEVRDLVGKLADMRLIEAKTTRAARFDRLEVEDIAKDKSRSRIVKVYDAAGNVLAEAILGRNRGRATGIERAGTYLRYPGKTQAWLGSGAAVVPSRFAEWLQITVMHVDAKNVRRVEVVHSTGGGYVAEKSTPDEAIKITSPLPEKKKVREGSTSRFAAGLTNVDLDDVMPAADFKLPEDHFVTTYRTFDGMEITGKFGKIGDAGWATFAAKFVGREGQSEEEAKAAKAAAEDIGKRTANWAYQLQPHVYSRLTVPLEEMLADIDEAPAIQQFPGGVGMPGMPGGFGGMPGGLPPGAIPLPAPGQQLPPNFPMPPEVLKQLQDAAAAAAAAERGAAAPEGAVPAPAPNP